MNKFMAERTKRRTGGGRHDSLPPLDEERGHGVLEFCS